MKVHLLEKFEDKWVKKFRTRLDDSIELSYGEEIPDNPQFEILIAGVPEKSQIETSPKLHTMIIPWAGLPKATRELMLDYPQISIHNLHHNAQPVAETAVALMLTCAKNIIPVDKLFRQNNWTPRYDSDYDTQMITGKTALILGYGAIGHELAKKLQAFDMKIIAIKNNAKSDSDKYAKIYSSDKLHKLLPQTNILFISLPLTPDTREIIGRTELGLLPDNAIVINIARGRIIEEKALFDELSTGRIKAGLDVWYLYPPDEKSRTSQPPSHYDFHKLENVVMTPHMAENTSETEDLRLRDLAVILNLAAKGKQLPNQVDINKGY